MPDTLTAPCALDEQWAGDQLAGVPCGEPSFAVVTFACVHEHVDAVRICCSCAADVQQARGLLVCPHCQDSGNPHDCPASVIIGWDNGEKTIVQEGHTLGTREDDDHE